MFCFRNPPNYRRQNRAIGRNIFWNIGTTLEHWQNRAIGRNIGHECGWAWGQTSSRLTRGDKKGQFDWQYRYIQTINQLLRLPPHHHHLAVDGNTPFVTRSDPVWSSRVLLGHGKQDTWGDQRQADESWGESLISFPLESVISPSFPRAWWAQVFLKIPHAVLTSSHFLRIH